MKQYSKRTAILHWLIFLLVVAAFYFGHQLEESKDGAQKLSLYPLHFLIGDLILLLTLVRLYFRKKDGEPAPANANPLLNKVAAATHVLTNLTVIAVVISGMATAATSGVVTALKANDPSLIPDFHTVAAKGFHELFIGVLFLLVAFHVVAALYHQFIVRDSLMRRIMIKRFPD
ncbi:MAG: cytochrome b/b6 domain-containing protein [Nitrosomonadales bacterium]|nr:cytochrome b/b6 domain-containing protein [Nitrosomonadales bacterium]